VGFIPPPHPNSRIVPQMIKKPDKREIIVVFILPRNNPPKLVEITIYKTQKY
jgi:hypothetical protein